MKISLVILFVLAAVVASEALQARRMTRPVNVRHSWEEWQQIMASQPRDTGKSYSPDPSVGRIINGNIATSGQFPFQAAIIMDSTHFCGGSLISNTVILTAGHCVYGISSFVIHLGTLSPNGGGSGSVNQNTRNRVLHSQYNQNTINNDIALIKLSSAVALSTTIKTIQLASGSDTYEGQVARVSGWGLTSDSATSVSSNLRYVDLQVISNTLCAQTYGNTITSTKLCTKGSRSGATCSGDSGGPLVIGGKQIGIVSFGSSAGCELSYPDAFTRVTSYLSWINSSI